MKLINYMDCIEDKKVWSILRLFLKGTNQVTGRKVSTLLGFNHKTCTRYLEQLVENNVLNKTVSGRAYLYSLRKSFLTMKVLMPLLQQESFLFVKLQEKLSSVFSPFCSDFVLIGDYATDDVINNSVLEFCLLNTTEKPVLDKKIELITQKLKQEYDINTVFHIIENRDLLKKRLANQLNTEGKWLIGDKGTV